MSRHSPLTRRSPSQVSVPVRRQDGTPVPAPPTSAVGVPAVGFWSPLTATVGGVSALVFADGDAIMVWSATP